MTSYKTKKSNKEISYKTIKLLASDEYIRQVNKMKYTLIIGHKDLFHLACKEIANTTYPKDIGFLQIQNLRLLSSKIVTLQSASIESLLRGILRLSLDLKLIEPSELANIRRLLGCEDEESIRIGLAIVMVKSDQILSQNEHPV